MRVFLSSPLADLVEERRAVEAAIARIAGEYIGMEHFGSFAETPVERCYTMIRQADVVVPVLGENYGSILKDSTVSYTEAEYREALKLGKPVLCYLREISYIPATADPRSDLARFAHILLENHGVSWFDSPRDLAWKVTADLSRELIRKKRIQVPYVRKRGNRTLVTPIDESIPELIDILEDRARLVVEAMMQHHRYAPVAEYVAKFQRLHRSHVKALRKRQIIRAHDILCEIHRLSYALAEDEFWRRHRIETPGVSYYRRRDHGVVAKTYSGRLAPEVRRELIGSEAYGYGTGREIAVTASVALYKSLVECAAPSPTTDEGSDRSSG